MTKMIARTCPVCRATFEARAADVARGWGVYCSKSCKAVKQESRTHQNARYHARQMWRDTYDDTHPFSEDAFR